MREAAVTVAEALRRSSRLNRFMSKVLPDTSGCWLWMGRLHHSGYGQFDMDARVFRSHRVAYEMFCGPVSPKEVVLHKCDNPRCVNPEHLQASSQKDNMRDMVAKGRARPGGSPTLTREQVDEIRAARLDGKTYATIAKDYGIHKTTARKICIGRTWK